MITKEKALVQRVGRSVDTQFVDTVRAEYKKERWMQNSARLGKPDSLSVWYDVTTLEEFLAACREHGADGVRYYFSTYPTDFAEVPEYAGRQSIVMVATRSKVDHEGNVTNKDLYINKNGENTILGVNIGNLCPPKCGSFGDNDLGITIIDKGVKEGFEII